MPKSKYPNQLDTSIEIPVVRDNVLEVGSDVINSLRSAIFNIEHVLGVNPQGAVGNSVANRLNTITDGNGNILKSALDTAGLLSGPVLDSDVSAVAAIQESKLKLNFPTRLLQSEISSLNSELNGILESISAISSTLMTHVNADAINRHKATAISVTEYTSVGSDLAVTNIIEGDVQDTFQKIYNNHINFTGENLDSDNRSHLSTQIYFDNTGISEITNSNILQTVIEDIANLENSSIIEHQDLMHSNGILRINKIVTSDNALYGEVLSENELATFTGSSGNSSATTLITFDIPVLLGDFQLEISDIITISDINDINDEINGDYEIAEINLSSDLLDVESIVIFGTLKTSSTSLTEIKTKIFFSSFIMCSKRRTLIDIFYDDAGL